MIVINRVIKLLLLTVLTLNYPHVVSAQLSPADAVKTLQGSVLYGSNGGTLNAGQSWGGRGPNGMYMYIQQGTPDGPPNVVASENWMHVIEMQHQPEAAWMGQIAMDYFNDGGLYWRHQNAWNWRAWRKVASEDWVIGQLSTQTRNNAGLQGNNGAKSGFFETANPTNYPNVPPHPNGPWWHLLDIRHTNDNNNYAMQFSGSFFDQKLYFRKTNGDATTSWSRVVLENPNGNVGIGVNNPPERLSVDGTIVSRRMKVTQSAWPDYVFEKDYTLRSLDSVEQYINTFKHLPEVTSAKKVVTDGLDLGDNQAVLLKKVEELTLYIIELNKKIQQLATDNTIQKEKIKRLESLVQ